MAYTAPMSFEIGTTVTVEVKAADGYTYDHMLVNGTKVIENPYTVTLKAGDADITVQPVVKQSGVTVSGKVVIATNLDGTAAGPGIIGIDVMVNGEVVATSAADGSFTATVTAGTTELTFAGPTTIDRTVSIGGNADVNNATVPIVVCDYSGDGSIDTTDKLVFANAFTGSEENVYCDLNGDGQVDATDKLVFSAFFMQKVNYSSLTLS